MKIEELKAGDVVLMSGGWGELPTPKTVERVTKTQIIVDGIKFRREGWAKEISGDKWRPRRISIATTEQIIAAKNEIERVMIAKRLKNINYEHESFSLDILKQVGDLIFPLIKTETKPQN